MPELFKSTPDDERRVFDETLRGKDAAVPAKPSLAETFALMLRAIADAKTVEELALVETRLFFELKAKGEAGAQIRSIVCERVEGALYRRVIELVGDGGEPVEEFEERRLWDEAQREIAVAIVGLSMGQTVERGLVIAPTDRIAGAASEIADALLAERRKRRAAR